MNRNEAAIAAGALREAANAITTFTAGVAEPWDGPGGQALFRAQKFLRRRADALEEAAS